MTKAEANIAADKLLSMMKTKGWKKRVFENYDWHYYLVMPIERFEGGASIHAFGDKFFCMISMECLGAGEHGLYDDRCCDDPNEAFEKSIQSFQNLANFLDKIKQTAYN